MKYIVCYAAILWVFIFVIVIDQNWAMFNLLILTRNQTDKQKHA